MLYIPGISPVFLVIVTSFVPFEGIENILSDSDSSALFTVMSTCFEQLFVMVKLPVLSSSISTRSDPRVMHSLKLIASIV